jgi:hypothetical protein
MDDEIIESHGGREQALHSVISFPRGPLNPCRSIRGRETTWNIGRYSPEIQFCLFDQKPKGDEFAKARELIEIRGTETLTLQDRRHHQRALPEEILYNRVVVVWP